MTVASEPAPRVGARVLLLNRADEVLLIHARDPDDSGHHWWEPPGGGQDPARSSRTPPAARSPRRPGSSWTRSAASSGLAGRTPAHRQRARQPHRTPLVVGCRRLRVPRQTPADRAAEPPASPARRPLPGDSAGPHRLRSAAPASMHGSGAAHRDASTEQLGHQSAEQRRRPPVYRGTGNRGRNECAVGQSGHHSTSSRGASFTRPTRPRAYWVCGSPVAGAPRRPAAA